MDKGSAISLVRQYKAAISELLPVKALYLFGSYSKGGFTDDSDIDVAVIIPKGRHNWFEDAPLLWTVSRKVSTLIEPVLLNDGDDSPLYNDVLRTGIKI